MKLKGLVICAFMVLVMFYSYAILDMQLNMLDYANLTFLNISVFPQYGLEQFNVMYIICYILLFTISLYLYIDAKNEDTTYLSLLSYRMTKKEFVLYNLKRKLKIMFINFSIMFITLLGFSLVTNQFNIDVAELLVVGLYILRFCFTLTVMALLYDIYAIVNKGTICYLLCNFVFIGIVIFEVNNVMSIISFSGDLLTEIKSLFMVIYLSLIVLIINIQYYLRKGDIL